MLKEYEAINKTTNQKEIVKIEEDCTILHDGKPFTSGGSFISEKYLIAYVSSDGKAITTWNGEVLTTEVRELGFHYSPFGESFFGKSYYIRFKYLGKIYCGIALGEGCLVRAKVSKLKSLWSD
jgi:hypothetical protein